MYIHCDVQQAKILAGVVYECLQLSTRIDATVRLHNHRWGCMQEMASMCLYGQGKTP